MNITYLRYAVEVAEAGGMGKAAEKMFIQQSNLSRGIKELESDLGIRIFERTPKGVTLTAEGDEFVRHAKSLLSQMTSFENMYMRSSDKTVSFSVSAPRASYMCEAFKELNLHLHNDPSRLYYLENNSNRTIENVLNCSCNLGVIRSEKRYDKYFFDYIASKGLSAEPVGEYRYLVTVGSKSVIAGLDKVTHDDLRPLTQIAFADPYVPYVSTNTVLETETMNDAKRSIFVVEAMSACSILLDDPITFMWRSPINQRTLDRFGLLQKECIDHHDIHSDILIWRRNYKFTDIDRFFIEQIKVKAKECGMKSRKRK